MVRIVKDEESTILNKVRYKDQDIAGIQPDTEEDVTGVDALKQVPLKLAYALTGHKAEGLTMNTTYPALINVFGYGLPYTMCTRTPYRHNMMFVGVPPLDLFRALVRNENGLTAVDRQRIQLRAILDDDKLMDAEVDKRIEAGEFNLHQIAKEEGKDVDACHADLNQKVRDWMQSWHDRLSIDEGIRTMVLTTGTKNLNDDIATDRLLLK